MLFKCLYRTVRRVERKQMRELQVEVEYLIEENLFFFKKKNFTETLYKEVLVWKGLLHISNKYKVFKDN